MGRVMIGPTAAIFYLYYRLDSEKRTGSRTIFPAPERTTGARYRASCTSSGAVHGPKCSSSSKQTQWHGTARAGRLGLSPRHGEA
jgi:hypothetical protein